MDGLIFPSLVDALCEYLGSFCESLFTKHKMTRIGDRLGPRGVSKQKQHQRGKDSRLYARPSSVDTEGHWTHDKFRDTGRDDTPNRRGGGASQVRVSNLHPAASAEDIRTIFSPFGTILSVSMVPALRGGGTQGALMVFSSKAGATAAINEFNGTLADGGLHCLCSIPGDTHTLLNVK